MTPQRNDQSAGGAESDQMPTPGGYLNNAKFKSQKQKHDDAASFTDQLEGQLHDHSIMSRNGGAMTASLHAPDVQAFLLVQ